MRINYGINRAIRQAGKKKIQHINGHLNITCPTGELTPGQHDQIRRRIRKMHPDWNLTGYAPVTPDQIETLKSIQRIRSGRVSNRVRKVIGGAWGEGL